MFVGAVELVVGFGVAVKDQPSRWIAVALLGLHATAMLLIIPVDPFLSAALLAVDIGALYALARYGTRTVSPSSPSQQISRDGRGSAERVSRQWMAWRRSAQGVTRTWNEWLAADHLNGGVAYRRFVAALAAEEQAAAEVMRALTPERDSPEVIQ